MPAKRRSNNTGSIFFEKARGYWTAQIQVGFKPNGRPKYKSKRSKKQSEVVTWLKAQEVQLAQGINVAPERLTVEQFFDRALAECKRSNRYSTHKGYAQICRDHVYPSIGKLAMAKVGKSQFQALIDTLSDMGKARNTIRNVKACLRALSADCEKEYPSAYHGIRAIKLPKIEAPVEPVIRALTPEQMRVFLAEIEPDRLKALYWVGVLLGLRESELLALRIEDLDLGAQTLQVAGAVQRQKGKGIVRITTKTSKGVALLPLPHVLVPILIEHLNKLADERRQNNWREHGLLFPSTVGTPISAQNLVNRSFKPALERAKLPMIRFHDLRHSCATLLISLGVHPRIIMEIMRHTQISTTMNIYGHVIPEVNRDAVNALGEFVMPERLEIPDRAPAPSDESVV